MPPVKVCGGLLYYDVGHEIQGCSGVDLYSNTLSRIDGIHLTTFLMNFSILPKQTCSQAGHVGVCFMVMCWPHPL